MKTRNVPKDFKLSKCKTFTSLIALLSVGAESDDIELARSASKLIAYALNNENGFFILNVVDHASDTTKDVVTVMNAVEALDNKEDDLDDIDWDSE